MAALSTAIAVAGLGVAAVGTVQANNNAKKQVAAQNEANKIQRQQANLQAARQKREAIRTARLAYAASQQNAENQGVAGSSASLGGLGSITSQLNDNLSFLDQWNTLSDQASIQLGKANAAGANAQMWNSVAGAGMTVFGNSDRIAGIFQPGKKSG